MRSTKKTNREYAICVNNTDYPVSLELHKLYRILSDEDAARDGDLRVIDESGEDYLYPADCFIAVEFPRTIQRALQLSFKRAVQLT